LKKSIWFRLVFEQRDINYPKFKEYIITTKEGVNIGLITFFISDNIIHIMNVYSHNKDGKLTAWFKQFSVVCAYKVVPCAIGYWKHIGATIVNTISNDFEDLVFMEDELDGM